MIVADTVAANLAKASWIRRMFEEGARLKQERGADEVFDFTLGNPEIEPPPAVLAAARRVLDSRELHLHAYMPNAGHPRVREAVAGRLRAATGLAYTAGHVLMTVGAGAALNTLLKALLNPGDEVLTVAPFFVEYTFYVENYCGRLIVVPPKADLTPDVARLEAAITSRTRAIILNSPNNPSGVVYPASTYVEIEAMLGRAVRRVHLHQPGAGLRERAGALAVGGGRGGRSLDRRRPLPREARPDVRGPHPHRLPVREAPGRLLRIPPHAHRGRRGLRPPAGRGRRAHGARLRVRHARPHPHLTHGRTRHGGPRAARIRARV